MSSSWWKNPSSSALKHNSPLSATSLQCAQMMMTNDYLKLAKMSNLTALDEFLLCVQLCPGALVSILSAIERAAMKSQWAQRFRASNISLLLTLAETPKTGFAWAEISSLHLLVASCFVCRIPRLVGPVVLSWKTGIYYFGVQSNLKKKQRILVCDVFLKRKRYFFI